MCIVATEVAVSLRQVARVAGVAPSTVSRAFSTPGRVARDTEERIRRIATDLGYVPEPPGGRHADRTVVTLVDDMTTGPGVAFVRGLQRRIRGSGRTNAVMETLGSADETRRLVGLARASADAIVLRAPHLDDDEILDLAQGRTVVVVGRRVAGVPSVLVDEPGGLVQAVDHLARLGHRRVAHVAGTMSQSVEERAERIVRHAAERFGLAPVRVEGASAAGVAAHPAAVLRAVRASGASAAVVHGPVLAGALLLEARGSGVDVPAGLGVVAVGDSGVPIVPGLTTVGYGAAETTGRAVAEILLGGWSAEPVIVPTKLVARGSTVQGA